MKPIHKVLFKALSYYGRWQARTYDIKNTIVMTGSTRSGTTWMGEILNAIPRSCVLLEPLNLNRVPEARAAGLNWRTYIAPGENRPKVERFIGKVLTGQVLNPFTTTYLSPADILKNQQWIIKFCRANRLLRWMTEKFPIRTPVLLMRHPCAVVASQMRFLDRPLFPKSSVVDDQFLADYPQFLSVLDSIETPEEVLAMNWCADYYVPLSSPQPHPWILVTYENMVKRAEREFQRIFNVWGMEVPNGVLQRLAIPSRSVRKNSPILTGEDRLAEWKKFLTKEQVQRVLNVLSAFGLDFYSEALEPDYSRLISQV